MRRLLSVGITLVIASSCSSGDRQNSVFCGLAQQEAGYRIMDQFPRGHSLLSTAPEELLAEPIPTRTFGYPTGASAGVPGDSGQVQLDFSGDGFPGMPGFGVALVDDSSEVFRGVVIFETQPGRGFPQIGTITGGGRGVTIPLFGMRIYWPSVSSDECQLFASPDTTSLP